MIDYNTLFVNFTWIIFPFILFLIYEEYIENINEKQNKLFLNFCLFSSLYLIMRFATFSNQTHMIAIGFDTIILIFYIKNNNKSAIITSIVGLTYLTYNLKLEIIIVLVKYIIYFLLHIKIKDNQKKYMMATFIIRMIFIIASTIILKMEGQHFVEYIFYYTVTYLIIFFLIKAEKIIQLHISYKELMKEKQLRESLFKISHEIKNPIAVCKGYLDMFEEENTENYKKYIPIIKSEINKTLNLLQDFSACKKIKIEEDILDITLLIEEITNNFKIMFDTQKIKFEYSQNEEEIYINGDYNRLNQVLMNIIKNSIEAIDKTKKSYIKINTKITNKKVKIYIEDNGIGISKENLKRISEPFFTTKQNGTGLGVLLSKEIIEAHNGKLEYKSEENIGTTVIITLPLYES